jgi:hypothetical protein
MPPLTTPSDALRHLLVTLSDRFEHALDGAPPDFAAFDAGAGTRTPLDLVRHLADLMRFAGELWTGEPAPEAAGVPWADEVDGFRRELRALDALLRARPLPSAETPAHRVLQGPLLDAITHVGQLVMLRRLAGAPVDRRRYARVQMVEISVDGG